MVKSGKLCGRFICCRVGWVEYLSALPEPAQPGGEYLFRHPGRTPSHQSGVNVQALHGRLTKVQLETGLLVGTPLRTTRRPGALAPHRPPASAAGNLTGFAHGRSPRHRARCHSIRRLSAARCTRPWRRSSFSASWPAALTAWCHDAAAPSRRAVQASRESRGRAPRISDWCTDLHWQFGHDMGQYVRTTHLRDPEESR